MQSVEELKSKLKPMIGKLDVDTKSKEIEELLRVLTEEESVVSACIGAGVARTSLIVLTNNRLLKISKDKSKNVVAQAYDIDKMESTNYLDKPTKTVIAFVYEGEPINFAISTDNKAKLFMYALSSSSVVENINYTPEQTEEFEKTMERICEEQEKQQKEDEERKIKRQEKQRIKELRNVEKEVKREKNRERIDRMKQKIEDRRLPKLKLRILNGHSKLKYYGSRFAIIQRNPGEIHFIVNKEEKEDIYYYMGFDRTENIKRSTLDTMGRAYLGGAFGGKVGAMGAAAGAAAKGEDKSTAVLFLVEKATGKDIPLVIKCDSDTLATLSLFIPRAKESKIPEETTARPGSVASEIKEFKELLDMGAITQEEFDNKKKQLLGTSV